jgi:hypothetical protein
MTAPKRSHHLVQAVTNEFQFIPGAQVDAHVQVTGGDRARVLDQAVEAADGRVIEADRDIGVEQQDHPCQRDAQDEVALRAVDAPLQQLLERREKGFEHFLVALLERAGGEGEIVLWRGRVGPREDILVHQRADLVGRLAHVPDRSGERRLQARVVARGLLEIVAQPVDRGIEFRQKNRKLDLLRQHQRLLPAQHAGPQRPQLAHALERLWQLVDRCIDQVGRVDVRIVGQRVFIGDSRLESQQIVDQAIVRQKILALDQIKPLLLQ